MSSKLNTKKNSENEEKDEMWTFFQAISSLAFGFCFPGSVIS